MPDITVTGIEETIVMLKEAPRTLVARGYTKALSAAGNVIGDAVFARTPIKSEDVGGLLDKGELRDSLKIVVNLDSQLRGGTVEVGFTTANAADSVALWLEYGHKMVGHRPTKKLLGFVAPKPFMRPAADESANAAVTAFVETLKDTVTATFPQTEVA